MPDRSWKRPRDVNELAAQIVGEVTEEVTPFHLDEEKDAEAAERGRRGGLKGGKARAEKMTPAERSESARRAAAARWQRRETG